MPDSMRLPPRTPKAIGIAADHGGYELKEYLAGMLRAAGREVIDFGDDLSRPEDDYPDFVVPMARAVAREEIERGVAVCGSGVGACIAANKVPGVRASLIHETFSARQGVEDDDLNVICLGGRVVGTALAWDLVQTFLAAKFSGADRHRRRLAKVAKLENHGGKIMKNSPLKQLHDFGQSVWLDYIRRNLIASGGLRRLIEEDGLRGMTSNPAIFEKAIGESHDYDEDIRAMGLADKSVPEIYEALSVADVQSAADDFRPLYDETDGKDGYVSLEVSPRLARDTQGTIKEARHLWSALNRPNVFIKVPGTAEGLPAIRQLISEGISVNVTLLFGLPRYQQVIEAYLAGLEARAAQGKPLKHVASVASFFVSRMDTLVDPQLEKIIAQGGAKADVAKKVRGEVAVASAKMAYQIYKEIYGSDRFKKLAAKGARSQRLLWASTGTKNPEYSDVKYVEALIGPDTVDTVPVETLDAYRDHGKPQSRLEQDVQQADWVLQQLPDLGINIDKVTQQLEDEGVQKFNQPFNKLMETLSKALPQKVKA